MPETKTSEQILKIARQILATQGLGAVSFDAIARELGRSKQAVLYWFPTKQALLGAMFLPWLEAEAEVADAALAVANDAPEAIGTFVRAVADFHFQDIDRFRMMYLVPQTLKASGQGGGKVFVEQVHPVTDRLYGALASRLEGEAELRRRDAVAIHASVLGLVALFGLTESLNDPLKHGKSEMVEAIVRRLGGV
ncbi:TetR/AcrR family transcriptional regulator [Thioclava pacifica]|uniref:HTH tetR-type domain-containing protein n=1 Tax=Thioclava pacifica DSM 10166 TaxID=1353537 RepID=A0A074JC20_9RHOB|nr:TetR/AcrR family transcriptional regulator [Thioclava pacifica]KEO53098.1 hypothetical protein TP2_09155 [Thioclava pacifica DSM 10166]